MDALDRLEILRYLGWRGQELSPELDAIMDDTAALCEALARPKRVHGRFAIERADGGIGLAGSALLLTGKDIAGLLEGASGAVLFAATLGQEIDSAVRRLSYTDMTRSVVLDAAATAMIERVCDGACAELAREYSREGLTLGERFSPGYGDLPLEIQRDFLAALNAGRAAGLSCTASYMLLPSKSVTAVMGLYGSRDNGNTPRAGCAVCPARGKCQFRRDGTYCGKAEP